MPSHTFRLSIGAAVGVILLLPMARSTTGRAATPVRRAAPASASAPVVPLAALASLSWQVPTDLPASPTQSDAVTFAWQSFVALNWPAKAGARGVPDQSKRIGQTGPVVWQTWKVPEEIFYPDGRVPPSWNTNGTTVPAQCRGSNRPLLLARTTKIPGNSANQTVESASREAVGGTLTDQHGQLAYFEVRMNQAIFDNIVAKQYYNIQGQNKATSIQFPNNVMEVKAAWRILTAADSAVAKRYMRQTAWIYSPASGSTPARCVSSEVGLVGMHITQKTASRPQWVWATFEHVDNVPPFRSNNAVLPIPYSFNNPKCPVTQCVPNKSTEKNGKPSGVPTQVTRVVNIGTAAQAANPIWQKDLAAAVAGSAYQYYQLIDVQWPQTPSTLPTGNPTPGLLANTTMETYNGSTSSCVNCHFRARTQSNKISSDYSYMLAEAHAQTTSPRR